MLKTKLIIISIIISSCGQRIINGQKLVLNSSYVLERESYSSSELNSKIYTNMSLHGLGVKNLIAENLNFSFSENALSAYLEESMDLALNIKKDSKYPDVFSSIVLKNTESIPNKYDEDINNFIIQNKIIQNKINDFGIIGDAASSAAIAAGVVPGATGIAIAASETIVKFNKIIIEDLESDKEKLTTEFLKKVIRPEDQVYLSDLNPQSFSDLNSRYNFISHLNDTLCQTNCSIEQKQIITNMITTDLIKMQQGDLSRFKSLSKQMDENSEKVESLEKNIFSNIDRLELVTKNLSLKTNEIKEEQQLINRQLQQITKNIDLSKERLDGIEKDMLFVKDFIYGKMSPLEKLKALESGAYGKNLNEEKRELLMSNLRFQNKMDNFVTDLTSFNQVLNNLGIKDSRVAKAVEISGAAKSLINNLMSENPNYLNAAVVISGLFSKQTDVAQERQRQIMEKLGVLDSKLDTLIESQKQILKFQTITFELIQKINLKLDSLNEHLEIALYATNINRMGISRILQVPSDNCIQFITTLENDLVTRVGYDQFTETFFSPFRVRSEHFSSYSKQFNHCEDLTNQLSLVRTNQSVHEALLLSTNNVAIDDNRDLDYLKEVFPRIVDLLNVVLNHNISSVEERKQRLNTLLVLGLGQYKDPRQLMERYRYLSSTDLGKKEVDSIMKGNYLSYLFQDEINTTKLLSSLVSVTSILKITPVISGIYYYFDIVHGGELFSLPAIIDSTGKGKNSKGYLVLKDLYNVQSLALIQSNLENGNILLPYVLENFQDINIRHALIAALRNGRMHNKKLEHAFVMFALLNKQSEALSGVGKKYSKMYDFKFGNHLTPTAQAKLIDGEIENLKHEIDRQITLENINRLLGLKNNQDLKIIHQKKKNEVIKDGVKIVEEINLAALAISVGESEVTKQYEIEIPRFAQLSSTDIWKLNDVFALLIEARKETLKNILGYEMEQEIFNLKKSKKDQYFYKKYIYRNLDIQKRSSL